MNRGVDIAKVPFIGGNLAIRLHVPFPSEQVELLLGKRRVHDSQWNAVESSIPSCKEGVFPPNRSKRNVYDDYIDYLLIRHRQDIRNVHVTPLLKQESVSV